MGASHPRRSTIFQVMLLTIALVLTSPCTALAYTQNIYNSANNNKQAMHCWCVIGSTRTWLPYVAGATLPSQTTINTFVTSKDKYNWTGTKCNDNSSGHDPRGWAWGMYEYTPAGYYYDDYKSTSQSTEDWEMVFGVRASSQPVGALVLAGQHAVLVLGYQDENDPFADKTQSLYGFYIFDPWYGNGNSGLPNWGTGFPPDSYITIANWNSTYYKTDSNDGAFWVGNYVSVLRSISGAPTDSPPESYGDYVYGQMGLAVTGGAGTQTLAASPDRIRGFASDSPQPTVADAVAEGLTTNSLGGRNALGIDLTGYAVGAVAHVTSLADEVPSYELADLRVAGQIRAVAQINDTPAGYVFAGLSEAPADYPFTSASVRSRYVAANSLTGSGGLVWAWASEGASPFTPYVVANDVGSGQTRYLTPDGVFSNLHLLAGMTPRG